MQISTSATPQGYAQRVLALLFIAGYALAAVAVALFLLSVSPVLGIAFVVFLWWREFLR